jgi:hypothetical protein
MKHDFQLHLDKNALRNNPALTAELAFTAIRAGASLPQAADRPSLSFGTRAMSERDRNPL